MLVKLEFVSVQELNAHVHSLNAQLQEDYAIKHSKQPQNGRQSLYISSKGNLGLSEEEAPPLILFFLFCSPLLSAPRNG